MHGIVAVTDLGWYEFLSQRSLPEVNFWTPSDRGRPNIAQFTPVFFRLKAPYRAIAGFAYFTRWSSLPIWLAWDTFGEGNGCGSLAELTERVGGLRRHFRRDDDVGGSNIGCLLLTQPTFFPPDQWVKQPADWRDQIVTRRGYDLEVGEGRRIWEECLQRAAAATSTSSTAVLPQVLGPTAGRYGAPLLVQPRLGQGTFRIGVLDAYGRACAITQEHSLPVLEAAHIKSYANDGPHEVSNGILMRADLHRLFDTGYITISPDFRLVVSPQLRERYGNGRSYYPLKDTRIRLPDDQVDAPAKDYLAWHRERVYLA